jgi:hypothetical protein
VYQLLLVRWQKHSVTVCGMWAILSYHDLAVFLYFVVYYVSYSLPLQRHIYHKMSAKSKGQQTYNFIPE